MLILAFNFGKILEYSIYATILWMILHITRLFIESLKNSNFPRRRNTNKPQSENAPTTYGEPFNLLLMIAVLIYTMIMVSQIVGFTLVGMDALPAIALSSIPLGFIGITLIFNLIQRIRGVKKRRRYGFKSETNELSKEDLMEQLISALLKDKKRAERQKRKKEKGDMQIRKKRAKRVPLSDVMTVEEFGYEIDKDRMNLQERNQEVLDTALRLIEESEDKEIRFETLLKELAGLSKDPRILMARVLLSILFLIADGFLYAEQEIETKRIWIMDLKHAKKLDYIS